jgi:hypothetical protein
MNRRKFLKGFMVAAVAAFVPLSVLAEPRGPQQGPPVWITRPQNSIEDLEREMAAWISSDLDDHDKTILALKAPWSVEALPGRLSVVSGRIVVRF